MTVYRRKPVTYDAVQFTVGMTNPSWLSTEYGSGNVYYVGGDDPSLFVHTPDGWMAAMVNDYVVRSSTGDLLVVGSGEFAGLYEAVP